MYQTITPNPNIPCKPGWCLTYVNEAFGVVKRFGTATAAWNGSSTQHRGYDFPSGVWFPIWFSLANEPAGHVALRAPDGSVYSTTDLSTTPRRHPNLADLMRIYAGADMALTYRGWTEDVEGTPVIALGPGGLSPQGTITPAEEDIMASIDDLANVLKRDDVLEAIAQRVHTRPLPYIVDGVDTGQATTLAAMVGNNDSNILTTRRIITDTVAATVRAIFNTAVDRAGGSLGGQTSLAAVLAYFDANVEGIVNQVKASPDAGIDQAQVTAAIEAAAKEALSGISITLTNAGAK